MKKTVRKFFRLLDRDINKINAHFEVLLEKYVKENGIVGQNKWETKLNIEKIMTDMFHELKEEDKEAFKTMEQAKDIREITALGGPINDFDLIQKFMKRYSFTELEQADVLAYFLHLNLKGVLSLKVWCVEVGKETGLNYVDVCKNMVMKTIAEEQSPIPGIKGALRSFLAHFDFAKQKEIREKVVNMFEAAERLKYVISTDGELLGCHNPHDYIKLTGASNFDISSEQLRLLLKASLTKHEEARKQRFEAEKLEAKRAANIHLVSQDTIRATDKERREALQALKEYLDDDKPKSFIGYEECEYLKSLLRVAGYDDNQIADIEKKITLNNESIVDALEVEAINNARSYLSADENLIVDKIIALLNDKNALKNAAAE